MSAFDYARFATACYLVLLSAVLVLVPFGVSFAQGAVTIGGLVLLLLPANLTASARRLQDTNRTPLLIPFAALIPIMLVWLLGQRGSPTANRYGEVPPSERAGRACRLFTRVASWLARQVRLWLNDNRKRRLRGEEAGTHLVCVHAGTGPGAPLLVLVHGTFASNATWPSRGAYVDALRQAMPDAAHYRLNWSGRNSHVARMGAANALATGVGRLVRERSPSEVRFICHSHGGNVALYALRNAPWAALVRGVVLLGTPFASLRAQSLQRVAAVSATALSWLIGIVILFGLPLSAAWTARPDRKLASYSMLFAFVGMPLFLIYLLWRLQLRDAIERGALRTWTRGQRLWRTRLRYEALAVPVYVARVPLDEAATWLRVVDAWSHALWVLTLGAAFAAGPAFLGAIAGLLGLASYDDTLDNLTGMPSGAFYWVLSLASTAVIAPLVGSIGVAAVRGTPWGFGAEGFLTGVTRRLVVTTSPPWSLAVGSRIKVFQTPFTAALRHCSFYDSTEVIHDTVSWLTAVEGDRAPTESLGQRLHSVLTSWRKSVAIASFMVGALLVVVPALVALNSAPGAQTDIATVVGEYGGAFSASEHASVNAPAVPGQPLLTAIGRVSLDSRCVAEGRLQMPNWNTTVTLGLLSEQSGITLSELSSQPLKLGQSFQDPNEPDARSDIRAWYSRRGKSVAFRREFVNVSGWNSTLFIEATTQSRSESRITGDVRWTCDADESVRRSR